MNCSERVQLKVGLAIIRESLQGNEKQGGPEVRQHREKSSAEGTVATFKSNRERAEELVERLIRYPELRDKMEELLDVVDNKSGDANKADDAEDMIWEELRQIGQRAMKEWAERKQERLVDESESRNELSKKEKRGSIGSRRSGESG